MDIEDTTSTDDSTAKSAPVEQAGEEEAPKPKAPKPVRAETSAPQTEVPSGTVIHMSALAEVCGNTKNSESVRWAQRRLIELGHYAAGSDLLGWLCEGTVEALAEYQAKAKVKADSERDRAVIESLMKGTPAKVAE